LFTGKDLRIFDRSLQLYDANPHRRIAQVEILSALRVNSM
jgi:hypothetical protein